jgi:hypothetical protein
LANSIFMVCFDHSPHRTLPYGGFNPESPMSDRSVYLREQAAKCRWHAKNLADVETQAELRQLADEYVDKATEIEAKENGVHNLI